MIALGSAIMNTLLIKSLKVLLSQQQRYDEVFKKTFVLTSKNIHIIKTQFV